MTPSPSSIRSFLRCPRRFYHERYVARGDTHPLAVMGTAVHYAMERYNQLESLVDAYQQRARELQVTDKAIYVDGLNMAIWLASVFPPGAAAVEHKFVIPFGEWEVQGIIDRIDVSQNSIQVVDFKTGNWYPTADELTCDPQVFFYHQAARALYPTANITVAFALARSQRVVTVVLDDDTLDAEEEFYRSVLSRMMPLLESPQLADFLPTTNRHCYSCALRSNCQAYADLLTGTVAASSDLDDLFQARYRLTCAAGCIEKELDRINDAILQQVLPELEAEETYKHQLPDGTIATVKRTQGQRRVLLDRAVELARSRGIDLLPYLTMPVGTFDKLVSKLPEDQRSGFDDCLARTEGRWQISVKGR